MTANVHQYFYKTANQSWNDVKSTANTTQTDAWKAWQNNVVQAYPGFTAVLPDENIDANTMRKTWSLANDSVAKAFWNTTHDANNSYYAAVLSEIINTPSFEKHYFKVTVEYQDGTEKTLINPLPQANIASSNT
jgi:hypothetical protein